MAQLDIVDRSSLLKGLYRELALDHTQTPIVAIDMHRGHLDMDVATVPTRCEGMLAVDSQEPDSTSRHGHR